LIIIAGSEITRRAPHGHMNAVFISDANALVVPGAVPEPFDAGEYYVNSTSTSAQQALDAANEQGAFTFWNHSWSNFTSGKSVITDFHSANAAAGKLHGIEVANGRTYSAESFQIALDHNLTLIGVSDVHNLIDWDYLPHKGGHRPVNLVFVQERSADAIRDALFARRTVIWYKNLLIGRPLDLMPLLKASLTVDSGGYRPGTEVLEVTLTNHSDANLMLENWSGFSIGEHDIIEVPAHQDKTLYIRTVTRLANVELRFEVLNALTKPGTHPSVEYSLEIDNSEQELN
ncbi:MAG: Sb-PDE family phosphodiesterase, partial [Gammaproteobacteria bacterium]|nr:Sb-PDE family phosphodiesterase [Gammaproteobacteria bacterium]